MVRKVRLITKTGIRTHSVKSTKDYIYVPKLKAYSKITSEQAASLKSGYSVQLGKNVIVKEKNVAFSLRRWENRDRLSRYSSSIGAIKKNMTAKRPKMLPPRIDSGVSGVAFAQEKSGKRVMPRREILANMRTFLKAKKYAIEHGTAAPRFSDYMPGVDSP